MGQTGYVIIIQSASGTGRSARSLNQSQEAAMEGQQVGSSNEKPFRHLPVLQPDNNVCCCQKIPPPAAFRESRGKKLANALWKSRTLRNAAATSGVLTDLFTLWSTYDPKHNFYVVETLEHKNCTSAPTSLPDPRLKPPPPSRPIDQGRPPGLPPPRPKYLLGRTGAPL
jgi:hypothetical protein